MNLALAKRKHNETKLLSVRSLTVADLAVLRERTPPLSPPKTLRDRHHRIALLDAMGKSSVEIAAECHVSPSRLVHLRQAPNYLELRQRYRNELETSRLAALRDFGARAAENMRAAEEIVADTLAVVATQDAASRDLRTINRIATDRMDRFGYGKTSKVDVNLDFGRKLEAAIARASSAREPKTIEHES